MESVVRDNGDSIKVTLLSVAVTAGGAMVVALAAARQVIAPQHAWMMMIALSLFVAPLSTVQIPGIKASIVLGDVVTFSCAILFGPAAAIIAATADGALSSLRLTKNYRKFFYNVATCALSMAGASTLTRTVFSDFGVQGNRVETVNLIGEIGLFTLTYFLISTMLIALYIAFSKGLPLFNLWREKFLWTLASYAASGISCLASYLLVGRIGVFVFLSLVSVMLIVFLSYRSYFQKVGSSAVTRTA